MVQLHEAVYQSHRGRVGGMAQREKPESWAAFVLWCAAQDLIIDDSVKARQHFELAQVYLLNALGRHQFFGELGSRLQAQEQKYRDRTGMPLFLEGSLATFELQKKTYASAIDKAYRLNVAWNRGWPSPPSGSWISPGNWHTRLDDLIRGLLVCKYMDGPEEVCRAMKQLADAQGLQAEYESRQLDGGYYAYHFYVKIPVEFPSQDMQPQVCDLDVEIQVTTQLQDLVRALTHRAYAAQRSQLVGDRSSWKWDYRSDRFKASYIAHTLHLIEGLIVDMRDKSIEANQHHQSSHNGAEG